MAATTEAELRRLEGVSLAAFYEWSVSRGTEADRYLRLMEDLHWQILALRSRRPVGLRP